MSQYNPKDLLLFAKVVELQSLSAAARETAVPKATLSRAISRLEAALDVRLLDRSSRRTAVTEAGRLLFEYCIRVRSALDEAESAIGELRGTVRGTLRVAATVTIGQALLPSLLPAFLSRYPAVRVRLELTNRSIEDPAREGFDVVLKPGPLADSSLVARELGAMRYGLFANPDWLARQPRIERPADVESLAVIDNFDGRESLAWELRRGDEVERVKVAALLDSNDALVRREAATRGAGLGCVPKWICSEAVESGQLMEVLPQWQLSRVVQVFAVWPSRRFAMPRLRAFLDHLSERLPPMLSNEAPDG